MKALAGVAVVAVVFLFAAFQFAPPEITDVDQQATADEVHQAALEWIETWKQNDLEGAMASFVDDLGSYFVGDPALFMNNLSLLPTVAAVRDNFGPALEARSATGWWMKDDYIAIIDNDHAVQVIEAGWNVTDLEGVTTPNYPMTATIVWVRQADGWRILHYHQTWTEEVE